MLVDRRNFYHEHPAVTARTQAEVDEFRRKREVHVVGTGVPRPVTNFEEASFPCEIRVKGVEDHAAGHDTPWGSKSRRQHVICRCLIATTGGTVVLSGAAAAHLCSDGLTQRAHTRKCPQAQTPRGPDWPAMVMSERAI